MSMKKRRKQIGRKRTRAFDRGIFNNRPIPESVAVRQSLKKAFPDTESRIKYLDNMIGELDRLIEIDEKKVAIVDGRGNNMSKFYGAMALLQGNGHGFNSFRKEDIK